MKFFKALARGHISRKQSFWLGCAILGAFFVISVIAIRSNRNSIGNLASSTAPEAEPTASTSIDGQTMNSGFVLKDFHRSEVKDGRVIWEIEGTKGKYIPEKNMAEIESPTLKVSRTDNENIVLVGKRALLYLSGTELSKAEIFDDIKLNYKNEVFVTTDHAIYDKSKNLVTSDSVVHISHSIVDVEGIGLVADVAKQEVKLLNQVRSIIKPRP